MIACGNFILTLSAEPADLQRFDFAARPEKSAVMCFFSCAFFTDHYRGSLPSTDWFKAPSGHRGPQQGPRAGQAPRRKGHHQAAAPGGRRRPAGSRNRTAESGVASRTQCQRGRPFATTSMQPASLTGTPMLMSASLTLRDCCVRLARRSPGKRGRQRVYGRLPEFPVGNFSRLLSLLLVWELALQSPWGWLQHVDHLLSHGERKIAFPGRHQQSRPLPLCQKNGCTPAA